VRRESDAKKVQPKLVPDLRVKVRDDPLRQSSALGVDGLFLRTTSIGPCR